MREHPHYDTELFRQLMQMPSLLKNFAPPYPSIKYDPYYQRKKTMTKLSVYTPPLRADAVMALEEEVCLKLTQKPGKILLEIVDPKTGEHATSGNLLNIYPDGTYAPIPGVIFGSHRGGFRNRYPESSE